MSRRTDVLNKYPAPRVSAVNQAVPGCSQGSYVSYTIPRLYCFYTSSSPTSTSFGRSCYDDVRTGSSGINQPAEIRECGAAGIFTICYGARLVSRRLLGERCDSGRRGWKKLQRSRASKLRPKNS